MNPVDYAKRRERLFSLIEGGVFILPSARMSLRNNDVYYRFRQDSTFHYFTGFDEPDAVAVLRNLRGKKEFWIFLRPRDQLRELWDGKRLGVDDAAARLGADKAFVATEIDRRSREFLDGAERVYFSSANGPPRAVLSSQVMEWLSKLRDSTPRSSESLLSLLDPAELISEIRLTKEEAELQRLREASRITALAHREAMARCRPGLNERQLEALIEFVAREQGAGRMGYECIVASGANATILHYIENNRQLREGDLLLIDAGAEYEYLTADLTRTFPVSGRFSPEQRALYEVVLAVQKSCIAMAKPGVTLQDLHEHAVGALVDALKGMGLLEGSGDEIIAAQTFKRFYPHGTGHFLGMDVHDCGRSLLSGQPRPLQEGMVFTLEPGLYVQTYDEKAPVAFRGLGVRIEDDIVLTATGCEVLTAAAPKEIADLEALVGSKPWLAL